MQLLKHIFYTHSLEANFRYVCGIRGCLYTFKSGQSFDSFKSHATRKHPNWQDNLSVCGIDQTDDEPPGHVEEFATSISDTSADELDGESMENELFDGPEPDEHLEVTSESDFEPMENECVPADSSISKNVQSAERTAATFLLTFKEQYKLTQTSINYAVGAINGIVQGVCSDVQKNIQELLSESFNKSPPNERCPFDISEAFKYNDPFAFLQTEHQQIKFYKDEFGLVVS